MGPPQRARGECSAAVAAPSSPNTAMSNPIESVARIANNPSQAKIFVAMLAAEGIPARIEGESLVDEFAASQRMLNLVGTRVMVPTAALQRAQEILQPVQIDPAELERAALGAMPEFPAGSTAQQSASATSPSWTPVLLLLLVLAIGAAVLFAFLWRNALAPSLPLDPNLEYRWEGDILSEKMLRNGRVLRLYHDEDRDGVFEQVNLFDKAAKQIQVADEYLEGLYLRVVETRDDGHTVTWTDENRDGLLDVATVTDRAGKLVQQLLWQPGAGFVLQAK